MTPSDIETYSIESKDIIVSKSEIAIVIGYGPAAAPPQVNETIEEVLEDAGMLCKVVGGYRLVGGLEFDDEQGMLIAEKKHFETRKVVFQQLRRSEQIAIFVCTAGNEIIEKSRALMKEGDFLKGYIYDVYGSLAVESGMDYVQESLKQYVGKLGLKITNRYSPGYCGWDVSEQKKLFSLLPDRFCGIELTDSCLMRPVKSVSGIIGIGTSVKFNPYTCSLCEDSDCLYRNLRRRDDSVE
ncbi:MAG TPA: vitamin B12 dependent-methionine synthase activation domain-containing protein [Candidatus Kryptonia bacterium]